MPRQHQKPRRPSTAAAESHARDVNLKLQLTLARQLRRAERDRQSRAREVDLHERDLLLDLARILDAKLTPSIDDWFERRHVAQVSLLSSAATALATLPPPAEPGDQPATARGEPNSATSQQLQQQHYLSTAERQRILEVKRADWFGLSSVPPMPSSARWQRPLTAAAGASLSAAAAEAQHQQQLAAEQRRRDSGGGGGSGGLRPKSAATATRQYRVA